MDIKVTPLGAGQDVGRSCILLSLGGKNIMFDCGMHMGYDDARRFPDFNFISKSGNFTNAIDCIIITHFHLDHCGALPYFTEMCGYDGPIYMTHPTKAICPILLEDYRKIAVERKGDQNFFTSAMIKDCMKKVVGVNVHQTVQVDEELEIRAYYAGHVLGAAMFWVRVGDQSVVYTGDYNMTPDRHLGAAWIEKLRPDVLITESTYATTIRDSKRWRERDFLKRVHSCVEKGGKVLIPVFALGRAQELCILLETYWERMNLNVPIYFSAGLTEKATNYYKLFIHWTNEKIKRTFVHRNMFDFKHISAFERGMADQPGPMVLFATPGMLHAGTSLEVFKKWCGNEKNLVIIPGYCVVGTVGNKLAAGRKGPFKVDLDARTTLEVRCKVKNLSFSAHADAKGIMQLIKMSQPAHVILVHGEKGKMQSLKQRVMREFSIPCYDPANGSTVTIKTARTVPIQISPSFVRPHAKRPTMEAISSATSSSSSSFSSSSSSKAAAELDALQSPLKRLRWTEPAPAEKTVVSGVVLVKESKAIEVVGTDEAAQRLAMPQHTLKFSAVRPFPSFISIEALLDELYSSLSKWVSATASRDGRSIRVAASVRLMVKSEDSALRTTWRYQDEALALQVLAVVDRLLQELPTSPQEEEEDPHPHAFAFDDDDEEEEEKEDDPDREDDLDDPDQGGLKGKDKPTPIPSSASASSSSSS